MDKTLAYAISAIIVSFGVWILIAGVGSSSPALWTVVGLVAITIGLISALGPSWWLFVRFRSGTIAALLDLSYEEATAESSAPSWANWLQSREPALRSLITNSSPGS